MADSRHRNWFDRRFAGLLGGVLAATLLAAMAVEAAAQEPASQPATTTQATGPAPVVDPEWGAGEVDRGAVQTRLEQAEAAADLDEATKTELIRLYRQTIEQIELAAEFEAKQAELAQSRAAAPADLEAVRAQLASATSQPAAPPALEFDPAETLEQLGQRLAEAEAALKLAQEEAKRLADEAQGREQRRRAIPELVAEAKRRLQDLTDALAAPAPAAVSAQLAQARRWLLLARRRAIESEIKRLETESATYAARADVLANKRELARIAADAAQARIAAWQRVVSERRAADAERQRRQAEEELRKSPKVVRDIAEQNARYAEQRLKVTRLIEELEPKKIRIAEFRERLSEEFRNWSDRIELRSDAQAFAQRMRTKRIELGEMNAYERQVRALRAERLKLSSEEYEIQDASQSIPRNLTDAVQAVMANLEVGAEIDRESLEQRVRGLLTSQRDLLDTLKTDYKTCLEKIDDLITQQELLLSVVADFSRFIDRHVLWIRSTGVLTSARLPKDVYGFLAPLVDFGRTLLGDLRQNFPLYALSLFVVFGLLLVQHRAHRNLREISERAARPYSDSYALTIRALVFTTTIVLPGPLLLSFLAWRCVRATEMSEPAVFGLGLAFGGAIFATATALLRLDFLRQVCRPKGLGESHFRWKADAVRAVRFHLFWLIWLAAPVVFIVGATERLADPGWRDLVGRLAFLTGMIALAVFAQRLLRPASPLLSSFGADGSTTSTGRRLAVSFVVAVPIALALASAIGYHYTAIELFKRVILTFWIVIGLILVRALLVRWLFVAQRRIAIEQAKKRRAAAAAAAAAAAESGGSEPAERPVVEAEEEQFNLVTIGDQTRRLLSSMFALGLVVGVLWIWADTLPAFAFLNDVELWSYTVVENDVSAEKFITLAHVILAMLAAFVTSALAKNIPGLLEITILKRLPLDAGGRYATITLVRYAITGLGVVVAFGIIGIGWSQVQWLVAAISVGLGFGLQEIFANFVSGIILLFERPIRVGDVVTVGNISGTVTRIRIRATTIMDWDRKELVIPNREFVTGQVINWTLSDRSLRVVLKVGVAYGSDVRRVEELLLRVGAADPRVMTDPKPSALFLEFGSSTLDFELRVFVRDMSDALAVRHDLNRAIDDAFRKAGIEIAFPQRDLHIRSIQAALPVETRLGSGDSAEGAGSADAPESKKAAASKAHARR